MWCCCFCRCCFQEDDEAAEDACDADEGAEAAEEEAREEDECLGDEVESEMEKDGTRGTFQDISVSCSRFLHYSLYCSSRCWLQGREGEPGPSEDSEVCANQSQEVAACD